MSHHPHEDDVQFEQHRGSTRSRERTPVGLLGLQQTAGNRAVAQMLAEVQRCGPGGCGPAGCSEEEKAMAAQAVAAGQDEAFAQTPVQRVATFAAGTVHEANNLADCVINGSPAGFTPPSLNGTIVLGTAATRAVMVRPTVTTAAASSGGGFDAQVTAVGTNTGSFDETVLAPGPWRLSVPKARIAAEFPSLTMCTGSGNTKFRAFGDPSDAAMYQANRRHEDHHATDHRTAFSQTIEPWDVKVTAASTSHTRFHGATAAAAEAALWAAMGGTPDEVADAYFNQCVALNNVYHSSPAGGPIGAPTSPKATKNCKESSAKYKNPS